MAASNAAIVCSRISRSSRSGSISDTCRSSVGCSECGVCGDALHKHAPPFNRMLDGALHLLTLVLRQVVERMLASPPAPPGKCGV
eukprot:358519-Chlamydomonas_euryale.AAC.3